MRINQYLKKQLRAQGARYQGELRPADQMAEYRMVPIKRLVSRLQLEPFYHEAPLESPDWQPVEVTLPLQQHIGAPAEAVVSAGDEVTLGQCIARPKADALGVAIHASLSGRVTRVDPHSITISRAGTAH